ncbi:hypothetical protein GCM10007968_22330 [Sporolactobacillus putidus]|uniref:Uncharacterized protein n=1 Tax=Sporolactobacillus putidus TaxID=492735 RepID=A0A917W1H9_9BACL|nr:hypothetical protein GCM10007968_22330 [Sporolactobacillus putidus]
MNVTPPSETGKTNLLNYKDLLSKSQTELRAVFIFIQSTKAVHNYLPQIVVFHQLSTGFSQIIKL